MGFSPDNHHSDIPEFQPYLGEFADELNIVLRNHYKINFSGSLESFSGVNINSTNFKFGDYFIKLLSPSKRSSFVNVLSPLKAALIEEGIPVADTILNDLGSSYTEIKLNGEDFLLIVEEFRNGGFFSGDLSELKSFFKCISKMQNLSFSADSLNPYKQFHVALMADDLLNIEPSKVAEEFRLSFEKYLEVLREFKSSEYEIFKKIEEYDGVLTHYDLHPHNVLYENGDVKAIIDLESFVKVPFQLSLAFGVFKHSRKVVAKDNSKLEEVRTLISKNFDLKSLKVYVEAELFRRLTIIFHFLVFKNDRSWIDDISKHINSLSEAEELFS